jgi:hypothetical protein|tara:strand:- start:39 stop:482 length:444 start_codon:yes stop_codon:yes gene_type:complete
LKLIAHRGNTEGSKPAVENDPAYIGQALNAGFDVEVDVWSINGNYVLGHDSPDFFVKESFLENKKLWCHAKNLEALKRMLRNKKVHCFWHEEDKYTITSKGYIWTYPEEDVTSNSVIVIAGWKLDLPYEKIHGICGDYVLAWSDKLK